MDQEAVLIVFQIMKTIWRVSGFLFKYKWLFWLTIGLAIGSTLFAMSVPLVIRHIFDEIVKPKKLDLLPWAVVALASCYLFGEMLNSLRIRVNNTVEQKVLIDLRKALHDKLLILPIGFFDNRKSGDIASRVIEDVQEVERVILDGSEQGSKALLMVFGVSGIMFYFEPLLATLMVLPIPLMLVMSRIHFIVTKKNWSKAVSYTHLTLPTNREV